MRLGPNQKIILNGWSWGELKRSTELVKKLGNPKSLSVVNKVYAVLYSLSRRGIIEKAYKENGHTYWRRPFPPELDLTPPLDWFIDLNGGESSNG